MRRFVVVLIVAVIVALTLAFEASAIAQNSETDAAADAGRLTPAQAKSIIAARAREVVRALKYRDGRRLSSFVHPTKGLRFSQYGTVDKKSDRVFSRSQVATMFSSNRRYNWGEEDGSGDPIRLSVSKYFKEYVYRQDMLQAKDISYNRPSKGGNAIPNVFESYPRAIIVTYHHPGSDPKMEGMDWQALWMVFEKKGQTWYLVGIISEEWTI